MILAVGCSEQHTPCGDGTDIGFAGAMYCVYRSALFEGCPSAYPNQYDYDDYQACGEAESPPDGLEEEIDAKFSRDAGTDASGPSRDGEIVPREDSGTVSEKSCEYGGAIYETGDVFCGATGCNSCTCNPTPEVEGVGCTAIRCDADSNTIAEECNRSLWHLADGPEIVSLGVFDDGTFRWKSLRCDASSGDIGIWRKTDPDLYLELLPAPGRDDFGWPDGTKNTRLTVPERPEATNQLMVRLSNDAVQVWEEGAQCPVCEEGTQVGQKSCPNPYAFGS